MKKNLWLLFGCGFLIALTYYIFLRSFEFEVKFKAATLPGDLIETIRIWDRSFNNENSLKVDSLSRLKQTIIWKGRRYIYDWHFTMVNDSTTKVNIQISEPSQSVRNKLLIPFTNQQIENDASEISNMFYGILKEHLKITSVKIVGKAYLDSSFCVCRSLETDQISKANGMMRDYTLLASFIDAHKLLLAGPPNVRILEWNHDKGLLKFSFCFPIKPTDSLPTTDLLIYKKFRGEKVIMAEYHGNYITSDRAWYKLILYARKNGYKVTGLPIEYFYNNPNLGLSQDKWRAEVYLPIAEK